MNNIIWGNINRRGKIKLLIMIFMVSAGGILSILPVKCMERMADLAVSYSRENVSTIIVLGTVYIVLELISNASKYYGFYLADNLQYSITGRIQVSLYEKLTRIGLLELKAHESNSLANIIIEDTAFLSENMLKPITDLLLMSVTFFCGLYYMVSISWMLTIMIIPLGIISSFSAKAIGAKARSNIVNKRRASEKLWKTFNEGIRGIIPLRISQAEKRYGNQVKKDSESLKNSNVVQSKLEKANTAVVSSLFMITIGVILLASCLFVISGKISVGGMTAVLMYNHMLVDPLVNLIDVQQVIIKQRVSLKRIGGVMEIAEQKDRPYVRVNSIETTDLACQIGEITILNKCNINIANCEKVAIVGETGCGKTTLANTIAGLISPTQGKIVYRYNGIINQGVPRVSYLYQDGYLFDSNIKENILIANPSLSDEEYHAIIKMCCLEGLASEQIGQIGENGEKLSGGERKRIRIARTLACRDADVYIFDELSTSLDGKTAHEITENILAMLKDKICIFIEHNLDIAGLMDETIIINNGAAVVQ